MGCFGLVSDFAREWRSHSDNYSCGSSTVAAGQASTSVNNFAVTATSHITVTLNADPGAAQLLWVERQTGSFTVHLTKRVQNSISFTYLVVEPFS